MDSAICYDARAMSRAYCYSLEHVTVGPVGLLLGGNQLFTMIEPQVNTSSYLLVLLNHSSLMQCQIGLYPTRDVIDN